MSSRVYSRLGKFLVKQDLRREIDPALQALEAGSDPVPTPTALTLIDDTTIPDGSFKYVLSRAQSYILDKTSALTVDGVNVLATKSGTGRWTTPALKWLTQAVWYIDGTAGSDLNDGLTALTAIKTDVELRRRTYGTEGRWRLMQNTTIFVAAGTLPTLALEVLDPTGAFSLQITGTETSIFTDVVASAVALAQATNVTQKITGTAVVSWTAHVNKIVRVTGGPRVGVVSRIAKDLGAQCR